MDEPPDDFGLMETDEAELTAQIGALMCEASISPYNLQTPLLQMCVFLLHRVEPEAMLNLIPPADAVEQLRAMLLEIRAGFSAEDEVWPDEI